jgi:AraC-like DNA-binding protein
MKSWKIAVKESSIAEYIDCYWFLDKTAQDVGPEYPKLNPDPAAHIIIANAQQPFHYEYDDYLAKGKGSHLILPYGKTYTLDHSQPFTVLGIKLKVGALYSLPLTDTHPLLNEVVLLDIQQRLHISSSDEIDLLNRTGKCSNEFRDKLDALLQPFIALAKQDKHYGLVRKIISLFDSTGLLDVALSDIGAQLGYSQRTIERSFSKVTGFTLKQYHTMQRLEAMLGHLHSLPTRDINWTDIALSFGFSDQPHLIRYLKGTMGSTPGQYAEARDLAIDAYGNFE